MVEIADFINITTDSRSGYIRAQVIVTYPEPEREEGAENLAVIMREHPHWSRSKVYRAAIALMADQIRNKRIK